MRAPPESLSPMMGAPFCIAQSITLQIFSACASDNEPPNTVKSWANTYTRRPSIRPYPVTTPSPRYFSSASPKLVHRCVTNRSSSTNVPGSSSASSRSRAVILPFSCWAAIRSAPPPSAASARLRCRSSNFSRIVIGQNLGGSDRTATTRRTDAQGRTRAREQEFLLPLAVFPCASAASVRLALPRLVLIFLLRGLRRPLFLGPSGGREHDPMMDGVHLQHLELYRLSLFHGVGRILDVGDSELRHRHEALDVVPQIHHDPLVHEQRH